MIPLIAGCNTVAEKSLSVFLSDDFAQLEILFEELRATVKVGEVEVGSVIKYGGVEWVVLERNAHLKSVLVVAKDCLFEAEFDDNNENNWAKSSLRKSPN